MPSYIDSLIIQSEQLSEENDFDTIIKLLSDDLLEKENNERLYYIRSQAHYEINQLDETIAFCQKAISINPDYVEAYVAKSNALDDKGLHDEAIENYTKAIELKSDYPSAYYNRGIAWENKELHDNAIQDYTTAINLQANYVSAYFNRGIALSNKGIYDKAIEDFTTAISLKEDHFSAYNARGDAYDYSGEHDKAIEDYTIAINLKENYYIAYFNRGIALTNKKLYDEAIKDFTTTISINKEYVEAYYNRGMAWANKEIYDAAIKDYTYAISLKSDYRQAYNARGDAFDYLGEHDKAIKDYTTAISLKKDWPVAYFNRGIAWINKKMYDNAIEDYTTAISLKSDYSAAFSGRGDAYDYKGDHEKAIEDYTTAINLNSNNASAYYNRGIAWKNTGSFDNAINDYSTAIKLNNSYPEAYNNRGLLWKNKEEYDKAKEDFTSAITVKNDYVLAYINRGLLNEQLNNNDEALIDYQKALYYDPNNSSARQYRDVLLAKLGRPIPAIDNTMTADDTFYKIKECTDDLIEQNEIMQFFGATIYPIIKRIRQQAENIESVFNRDQDTSIKYVAHYTNLRIADLLIMKDETKNGFAKLRYSNAVFMNDPDEGKTLIDSIDHMEYFEKRTNTIKKSFYDVLKGEQNNFYLGSFLPVIDDHEDELLMWRTYGKDDQLNEAAGCCLLIDTTFFDKNDSRGIAIAKEEEPSGSLVHPLYRVLYYNRRKNEFENDEQKIIQNEIANLKNHLLELLQMKKEGGKEVEANNKAIDQVIYHTLSELRYFFKSSDYSYESELRVIQFASHKDTVRIDTDNSKLPRKLYIESTKGVKDHIKKIVLGPKVQHPDRWLYLQKQMENEGHSFEIVHSNCHFQ